jgi:hypothetical protein
MSRGGSVKEIQIFENVEQRPSTTATLSNRISEAIDQHRLSQLLGLLTGEML